MLSQDMLNITALDNIREIIKKALDPDESYGVEALNEIDRELTSIGI